MIEWYWHDHTLLPRYLYAIHLIKMENRSYTGFFVNFITFNKIVSMYLQILDQEI